jgi:hypothetical protein
MTNMGLPDRGPAGFLFKVLLLAFFLPLVIVKRLGDWFLGR